VRVCNAATRSRTVNVLGEVAGLAAAHLGLRFDDQAIVLRSGKAQSSGLLPASNTSGQKGIRLPGKTRPATIPVCAFVEFDQSRSG